MGVFWCSLLRKAQFNFEHEFELEKISLSHSTKNKQQTHGKSSVSASLWMIQHSAAGAAGAQKHFP